MFLQYRGRRNTFKMSDNEVRKSPRISIRFNLSLAVSCVIFLTTIGTRNDFVSGAAPSNRSGDPATPYLIFSNRHELRSIILQNLSGKVLLSGQRNVVALDVFHSNDGDIVFWTDVTDDKIYRAPLVNGVIKNITVVHQVATNVESLSVDWICEHLYWIDSTNDHIGVSNLDGSYRKTLIAGNMGSPRAIALDPRYGMLFWSDWDAKAPKIERASMSGEGRKVIFRVDSSYGGAWPNALTLDYTAQRIYWLDAKSDSMHTTKYDGTELHTVLQGHALLAHPFAVTIYENYVYWTDWRSNSVNRANKWNGTGVATIVRTITQPFGIQVVHPSRQPRDIINPCANNNGGCSHLCLLSFNSTFQCHCPHIMMLDQDNKTCIKNEVVLMFSRPYEIHGVDLKLPYHDLILPIYHTQVDKAAQIDFDATQKKIYWVDTLQNVIKRSSLTKATVETVLNTGLENPRGFGIDWVSRNMFFTSFDTRYGSIFVSNLNGQYVKRIIHLETAKPMSLAVHPFLGKIIWADHANDSAIGQRILMADMDGSNMQILTSQRDNSVLNKPMSLTIDFQESMLYWVNTGGQMTTMQLLSLNATTGYDIETKNFFNDPSWHLLALTLHKGNIIYTAKHNDIIGIVNKYNFKKQRILRNNTPNVLAIKVYDEAEQSGSNACQVNLGNCSQLCLPQSGDKKICACAAGYSINPSDSTQCVSLKESLIYSLNGNIYGMSLEPEDNSTKALLPIPGVVKAVDVGFTAENEFIYWANSDEKTLNRIRRDGTGRHVIVSDLEAVAGIAIDWVAENLFLVNPSSNVIEVTRLNGTLRYIVVSGNMSHLKAIVVHPESGYMFWNNGENPSTIERATLDGKNRIVLVNSSVQFIRDLAIDEVQKILYWSDQTSRVIEQVNFDGTGRKVVMQGRDSSAKFYNEKIEKPLALTVYGNYIYYTDSTYQGGSINRVHKTNSTDFLTLKVHQGDSLKDIIVLHHNRLKNSNPCAFNNGGCKELCLYQGDGFGTCACFHGKIAADGLSCEDFDEFLIYSLRKKIISVPISENNNMNSPFPEITDKKAMLNAIGLAFDFKTKRIFYSDIQLGSINSIFFNGSNHQLLLKKENNKVEGIAFDAFFNELYWTSIGNDFSEQNASINKMSLASSTIESTAVNLIKLSHDDRPRGIAVHGCESFIFWTNWRADKPSIQRSDLSGNHLRSIITTDIVVPNGIALDHQAQRLYWVDARLDKIERCNLDGKERYILLKNHVRHPFDIAIFGNDIFWSDWGQRALLKVNKYTGEDVTILRKGLMNIMGIAVIAKNSQNCDLNPCYSANFTCKGFCDISPDGTAYCRYDQAMDGLPNSIGTQVFKGNQSEVADECVVPSCKQGNR